MGATCALSPSVARANPWTVDFSGVDPPANFVALRALRDDLRVPPVLGIACHGTPFGDQPRHGEDFPTRLLAEVELLDMLETPGGRAALDRVVVDRKIDDEFFYIGCIDDLAPGFRISGANPDTTAGWLHVKNELEQLPELFGVPGTNNTTTGLGAFGLDCERNIEEGKALGDNWDMTMALVVRVWLRGRDHLRRALHRWYRGQIHDAIDADQRAEADFTELERHISRVAWLEGSPSIFDMFACPPEPETENHFLMIETTRFLHNESLPLVPRADLGTSDDDPERWLHLYDRDEDLDNERNGTGMTVRDALKRFVDHDFVEYNARSYSRHQMVALLNLYDLAEDEDIRRRAEAVLDLLAAKFAAESMDGLRTIPYRRRAAADNDLLFDGDPLNPMFQVWVGALAPTAVVPSDGAGQMTLAASSEYHVPDLLVDAILNPSHHRYLQEFDGAGQRERAFGARDFTLSGGGQETDCPYPLTVGGAIGSVIRAIEGHCVGSGNDHGTIQPIVVIPQRPRVPHDASVQEVGRVIHTPWLNPIPLETVTVPRSLACIGNGFACGPAFSLGAEAPKPIPECTRDYSVLGDEIHAWRFDYDCAGVPYAGACFFAYTRSMTREHRTFKGGIFDAYSVDQPPLAYLVLHECNPRPLTFPLRAEDVHCVAGSTTHTCRTAALFDEFVDYLTSGPGAPTRPPTLTSPQCDALTCRPPQECASTGQSGAYCGYAIQLTVPTFSGPVEAGEHVTLAVRADGGFYTAAPAEDGPRALVANGSLVRLQPLRHPVPNSDATNELVFDNDGAGEHMWELDTGGVSNNSNDEYSIEWTVELFSNGMLDVSIARFDHADQVRTVQIEVDDATDYGRGCTLSNGLQGCYSLPCFAGFCDQDRPQTHYWRSFFTATYPLPGRFTDGVPRPLRIESNLAPPLITRIGRRGWTFDPTHDYWVRSCVTWYRFATPADYRFGFSPDAHTTCPVVTLSPTCEPTSIACRSGRHAPPLSEKRRSRWP